jgi:hypothetical protein
MGERNWVVVIPEPLRYAEARLLRMASQAADIAIIACLDQTGETLGAPKTREPDR